MSNGVTNVVIAGLGGQGILTASDILADVAFRAGHDVKKAEVHGMSQRGGSVTSDVRFGKKVLSPMVPVGGADYLLVFEDSQLEPAQHHLAPDGILILCNQLDIKSLPTVRALNVAMLGMLSVFLDFEDDTWREAVKAALAPKLHEANMTAFDMGQAAARPMAAQKGDG